MIDNSEKMKLAIDLYQKHQSFIESMRLAVNVFEKKSNIPNNQHHEKMDGYPRQIFNKTYENFLIFEKELQDSILKLKDGNDEKIIKISSHYTGLSKKMDFDYEWMNKDLAHDFFEKMDKLISSACTIKEKF